MEVMCCIAQQVLEKRPRRAGCHAKLIFPVQLFQDIPGFGVVFDPRLQLLHGNIGFAEVKAGEPVLHVVPVDVLVTQAIVFQLYLASGFLKAQSPPVSIALRYHLKPDGVAEIRGDHGSFDVERNDFDIVLCHAQVTRIKHFSNYRAELSMMISPC